MNSWKEKGKTKQLFPMKRKEWLKKIGMQTMDDSLFSLYLKHKIDAANAVEYAQNTGNMQQKLF